MQTLKMTAEKVLWNHNVGVIHLYASSSRLLWCILFSYIQHPKGFVGRSCCCWGKCLWSELVGFGQTFMTSSTSWLWHYHPYRDYKENSIQWLCLRGCNHISHEGTDIYMPSILHSLCWYSKEYRARNIRFTPWIIFITFPNVSDTGRHTYHLTPLK